MADSAGKLVLEVVKKNCQNMTCSYRAGDSGKSQAVLVERIDQKLKHRVADGNDVRTLEARVAELEKVLKQCLQSAISRKSVSEQEAIKKVLLRKKR